MSHWTIGDVIRKARVARRWSQTKLGKTAVNFQIGAGTIPINKSTVSKVEKEPYTSELGTVWRLLAALDLTFGEVEHRIGAPFTERRKRQPSVSESHPPTTVSTESGGRRKDADGRALAPSSALPHGQIDPVAAAEAAGGAEELAALLRREARTDRQRKTPARTRQTPKGRQPLRAPARRRG